MRKSNNFLSNPSKKTLMVFTLIWFIGNTLLILGSTDLFQKKMSTPVLGLVSSSSLVILRMFAGYLRNKEASKPE